MRIATVIQMSCTIALLSYACPDASGQSSRDKAGTLREPIDIVMEATPGMTVVLRHTFGDIDVSSGSVDTVHIVGEKRVTGNDPVIVADFMKLTDLKVEKKGKEIVVETRYPNDEMKERDRKKITSFSITYEIVVPNNTVLDVRNEFGNIVIGPITGSAKVTNGFGKVAARDIEGPLEINNKFGGIKAENIVGNLRLGNEHGGVVAMDITGDLSVSTSFSTVDVTAVSGKADVRVAHGKVVACDIGGNADIETSYSPLECRNVGGEATLRNAHGSVTADTIGGATEITTKFGEADIRSIKGTLTVTNEHGAIKADDIAGNIQANTSFASIKISRFTGNITAINQHGSITVSSLLAGESAKPRSITLKSSFNTITLSAPSNLSATLKGVTSFGDLQVDYPITLRAGGLSMSNASTKNIEGVIGDGRDSIIIENSNGSIKVVNDGSPMASAPRPAESKRK